MGDTKGSIMEDREKIEVIGQITKRDVQIISGRIMVEHGILSERQPYILSVKSVKEDDIQPLIIYAEVHKVYLRVTILNVKYVGK